MISGVIVTHNSQNEILDCLESLNSFVDEIVVLDLDSGDLTVEVATKNKARVISHKPVEFVELVRQEAINLATHEWIVLLDPDERLSPGIKAELKRIAAENKFDAVNIPRKNIFFGNWIKHTNFWPDRQIRFFKKSNIVWSNKIHSYPKINGIILDLAAKEEWAIEHYGYNNFSEFFERQNRYSTVEAQSGNYRFVNLIWKPLREFLVRFVKHHGYKDGFLGVSLVYSLMITQLMIQIKLWEKSQKLSS